MKNHFDLSDDAYYDQVASGELRRKYFTHEAHIRLAWIHICRHGAAEAEVTVPRDIKQLVTRFQMGRTFNQTISIASVRILNYFIQKSGASTFQELVCYEPKILADFRGILAHHYSDKVYTDPIYKQAYVEPDLNPLMTYHMTPLFTSIAECCDALVNQFDKIDDPRKAMLDGLSNYLSSVYQKQETPKLIVICTHNSRRSHMGQLWLAAAAAYYGLPHIETYSGGTEGTAFYPSAVDAMRTIGFQIVGDQTQDNPHYLIQWRSDMTPYEAFSTRFDAPPNPTANFGAIMVCTSADEACPIVSGADFRVALPFDDPKAFDGTALESAKYLERSKDIAREMLYVMSQVITQ